MALRDILEALDQLLIEEMGQVRRHINERESYLASVSESDDLESMVGLLQSSVTDASVNARQYLRDIFRDRNARPR